MGKPVLKISRKTPEEITEILKNNADFLLATRLNMVYHVSKGRSSREVASWYGVSFKQVINWVHRFEQNGVEGLESRSGRGRKSYLTDEQMDKVRRIVLDNSPGDFGINAKRWSGPGILKVIKEQFGVDYKPSQSYKLIDRM
ncbi:transposase, partial [Dyadobacter jejuensis]